VAEPPAVPATAPASPTLLRITVCAETLSGYFLRSLCARFFHHSTGKNWGPFLLQLSWVQNFRCAAIVAIPCQQHFFTFFLEAPDSGREAGSGLRQKQHRIPNLHLGKLILVLTPGEQQQSMCDWDTLIPLFLQRIFGSVCWGRR
jgi:hypothetical protein